MPYSQNRNPESAAMAKKKERDANPKAAARRAKSKKAEKYVSNKGLLGEMKKRSKKK